MILGISGRAGVGKDTAADYFVDNYGFVKLAFADVIKRMCMDIFEFTEEQLWGESKNRNQIDERYNFAPRKTLQDFGDCGRNLIADIWIDYTLIRAIRLNNEENIKYYRNLGVFDCPGESPKHVVISDVRFLNEIKAISNYGGLVARVLRPQVQELSGEAGQHSSERDQKLMNNEDFDFILDNSGTKQDLYHQIDQFIKAYL